MWRAAGSKDSFGVSIWDDDRLLRRKGRCAERVGNRENEGGDKVKGGRSGFYFDSRPLTLKDKGRLALSKRMV